MLRRIKNSASAYKQALKTAYDPARIAAAHQDAMSTTLMMPTATQPALAAAAALGRTPPLPSDAAAAARRESLRPYLAPAAPVRLDRFVVGGEHPATAAEVLARAGLVERSHEVYGAWPSPDVLRPGSYLGLDERGGRSGGAMSAGSTGAGIHALGPQPLPWCEWVVAHSGGPEVGVALQRAATEVALEGAGRWSTWVEAVDLEAGHAWLDRPRAQPLPVDEDVAALLVARGGIDPARCLGVHRVLQWGVAGPPQQRMAMVEPTGVRVLARADAGLGAARQAMAAGAPVRFHADEDLGVRADVLDLTALFFAEPRAWTDAPPPTTTRAQLPADGEEVLVAWLEIVGVAPSDCVGVAVTVAAQQSAFVAPSTATSERGRAATLVTVTSRERPHHAAGRDRFARWLREQVGLDLVVERAPAEGLDRKLAVGTKAAMIHQLGIGTFRDHGLGTNLDALTYPWCAGPRPPR